MSKKLLSMFLVTAIAVTTGCQTSPSQEDTGKVVGGILGGVLGSQVGKGSGKTAATIAGALIGVYIGGAIGKSMDENDRYRAQQALEHNPTNQPSAWRNPDTGNEYSVTPTRTYYPDSSQACREYTTEAVIDGRREIIHGTACRQPDGTWRAAD